MHMWTGPQDTAARPLQVLRKSGDTFARYTWSKTLAGIDVKQLENANRLKLLEQSGWVHVTIQAHLVWHPTLL